MTNELRKDIEAKSIFTYHLVDGSHIVAEEVDYDINNEIAHILSPMQLIDEDNGYSFREWSVIDSGQVVHLRDNKIVAQSKAPFKLKKLYLEFNLLAKMHEFLTKDEIKNITSAVDSKDGSSIFGAAFKNKKKKDNYTGWDGYPKPWPPEEDIDI